MDTIEYYNKYARTYFENTVNAGVAEILEEFASCLAPGAAVLDLGCGSGRDSLEFYERGFDVTSLDASSEMCKLAQIHAGTEVLNMRYEEMDFREAFEGIWACASLVHVPKAEMAAVLHRLAQALKPEGILYLSYKEGDFEGFRGERYFSDYTRETAEAFFKKQSELEVYKVWHTLDAKGRPEAAGWLNLLVRKKNGYWIHS